MTGCEALRTTYRIEGKKRTDLLFIIPNGKYLLRVMHAKNGTHSYKGYYANPEGYDKAWEKESGIEVLTTNTKLLSACQ
jgi:hypothetical protein